MTGISNLSYARQPDAREKIAVLLPMLRSFFQEAVQGLTARCARSGTLDVERFEYWQESSYQLALSSAELAAAQCLFDRWDLLQGPLERRLALVSIVETLPSVATRLERVFLDIDANDDRQRLYQWMANDVVATLRGEVIGAAALAETGRLLVAHEGAIGEPPLSEELAMARDAFQRLARERVAPLAEAIHREDLTVPEALLQPLRELGLFGLSVPTRYGGSADDGSDDNLMMLVVTEALSEVSLGGAGSLITRPEILTRALLAGGTEDQKAHWLPRIANGEPLCAIAITEPDYGSDVAGLALRATPVEGGWRLNGTKTWCTFAGKAGLLLVIARTDPDRSKGHRGLSAFLVEKPSFDGHDFAVGGERDGRLTGRAIATIGYRGMHSFELAFEDYFVPADHLIGGENGLGKGFYLTMTGMMGGRLQTAGRACGVMRAALGAAVQYSRDRRVFGEPLAAYPLTLGKLTRMAGCYLACRQLAYAVAADLTTPAGRRLASQAKLLACRGAETVTREALQLHGGMGYAEEMPVSRYFVDARVLSIFEGAEETLALKVIARGLLEEALREGDDDVG
ncbi:acyl-CoA dehydrogenase family protein [Alloalcanivorax mobilis]|uniref:acyl-CoA dehydrogenase family protein n=1 Tax=Alloalcanivorax mobilis TaxID=2019569 RepID=UPI0018E4076E|nr:acyl-CoA dehydrogenase [Alloalcanivorax mobilis]|tara:strand:- start:22533 stop:24245 length:1713 start_codon:yes stop_codon:yes gene_type:complete